ncbi:hypothetical protein ZHAS_00012502 [Anopheles sinensis]|uniref:Uncharacterized protein n=1 Tax=Anopheles sinensis TaxID=74873 RepID=A0A084W325_ANOSI|nr:hypothetical protein ZHAS_00012502 [Anopheles sinensis]
MKVVPSRFGEEAPSARHTSGYLRGLFVCVCACRLARSRIKILGEATASPGGRKRADVQASIDRAAHYVARESFRLLTSIVTPADPVCREVVQVHNAMSGRLQQLGDRKHFANCILLCWTTPVSEENADNTVENVLRHGHGFGRVCVCQVQKTVEVNAYEAMRGGLLLRSRPRCGPAQRS